MEDKFYKELLIDLNKFAIENTTCKKVRCWKSVSGR